MMMVSLQLLMRRRPCHCRDGRLPCNNGIVALDGVVALIGIELLPSSSWRSCPHCNGVIIIINVIALVARRQAGIAAINAQVYLTVLRWQMLLLSRWRHCPC
jgi:hypothetical protein